jgi:hypothetical protein
MTNDRSMCAASFCRGELRQSPTPAGAPQGPDSPRSLDPSLPSIGLARFRRRALRERVQVEHALAHIAARKGEHARYIGVRKNLFDLRRAAMIQNLEAAQRMARAA